MASIMAKMGLKPDLCFKHLKPQTISPGLQLKLKEIGKGIFGHLVSYDVPGVPRARFRSGMKYLMKPNNERLLCRLSENYNTKHEQFWKRFWLRQEVTLDPFAQHRYRKRWSDLKKGKTVVVKGKGKRALVAAAQAAKKKKK